MDSAVVEEIVERFDSGSSVFDVSEQFQLLDRLAGVVLRNVQEVDGRHDWAISGYPSLRSWLRQACFRSDTEAGSISATSRKLRSFPRFQQALIDGDVTRAQIGAVCANVSDKTVDLFAAAEPDMLAHLVGMSIEDTTTVMRAWAERAKDATDSQPGDIEDQAVHLSQGFRNSWTLDGQLNDQTGQLLSTALDACMSEPVEGDPVLTKSQRRANALAEMCNRILASTQLSARRSSDMTVIFRLDDYTPGRPFATYVDDTIVPVDRLQRMLCDAVITLVGVDGDGQPLKMGRAIRTASPAQWRALVVRDRHCAFPGCRRPPSACDAHHVHEYDRDNGPTDIENLTLLCRFHHSLIHKSGWMLRHAPGIGVEVHKPDGQILVNRPPPKSRTA